MPNLGTKAGDIVPSGGKIAGGGANPPFVSSLMSYGSFSGADIKVIVHYPRNRMQERIVTEAKQLKEAELAEEYARFWNDRETYTVQELEAAVQRLEALRRDIENTQEALDGVKNLPTSKTLGEIQTISWGIYRDKGPVRTLGSVYPRAYVRGPRCIPATEKVLIKDKGYISIADVKAGDYVQSSEATYDKVVGAYDQGFKLCYSLRLANGYNLIASFDHPISTPLGWKNLSDLKTSDYVNVVGSTPCVDEDYLIKDEILKLVGYLIGDGSTHIYNYDGKKITRIGLSISDKEFSYIGSEVQNCLSKLNIGFTDHRKKNDKCITRQINVCTVGNGMTDWKQRQYNELHETLLKFNLYNKYSHTKEIPQELLASLSRRQIKILLRRLFAADGSYSISKDLRYIEFHFTSTSETLVDQVRLLLSKLGINTLKAKEDKIGKVGGRKNIISRHNSFSLIVSKASDLLRFIKRIGIFGKDKKIYPYIDLLKSRIRNEYLDISAKEFWNNITSLSVSNGIFLTTGFRSKYAGYDYKLKITPRRALMIANEINLPIIDNFVNTLIDNLIDKNQKFIPTKVVSINLIGNLRVYDLEVESRHCFICNFIKVHNTISGSMIFTIFYEHVFHELLRANLRYYNTGTSDYDRHLYTSMLSDQLPPLDISLVFANEYGAISHMGLFGVEFFQEGGTFSIEDIYSENTIQYVARDLDPMRIVEQREIDSHGVSDNWATTASDMLNIESYVGAGVYLRRNPFI